MTKFGAAPKLLPNGGTVVCIGGGPSLTREDVEACRGTTDAQIVINNGYLLAPWATALYGADARWWDWHKGVKDFPGLKFTISPEVTRKYGGVVCLKQSGDTGLDLDPHNLRTGRNGGYQAINLAVHFGATRILLLGYDMDRGPAGEVHWHGHHPNKGTPPFDIYRIKMKGIVKPLAALGIPVLNCSRRTALDVFPRQALEAALRAEAAA